MYLPYYLNWVPIHFANLQLTTLQFATYIWQIYNALQNHFATATFRYNNNSRQLQFATPTFRHRYRAVPGPVVSRGGKVSVAAEEAGVCQATSVSAMVADGPPTRSVT